ncbi:MAG: ATP-binding protein [Thermoleophilia bacterium]|nr:ATP-binding protein [Thermoleophilia bacterium]MDH4340991.1 ATP-binding protein [Thermoleophilia bacterium]MDH5280082.1 ATP-binding protein [Thermoleophilia bacterium]
MQSRILSMRWWLALAFASIAALTAVAVAQVFNARSEDAIRARARELTAGSAVTAALEVTSASDRGDIQPAVDQLGESQQLALFVFDRQGSPLTPEQSRGINVASLPNFAKLRDTALQGRRVVDTVDGGRLVTVALPLRGENAAVLIAVAARPDLEDALGIVRAEILRAALWAVAIGALAGLGVALLITRRLRRIATAAADIEQGRFDRELRPHFHDELGTLAGTIDRMREHLRRSFEELEEERDRLQRLLEQLQEGVVAVDDGLVVQFANSRAHRLLGTDLAVGKPLPEPWPAFSLREAGRSLFDPGTSAETMRVHPDPERTYLIALLPATSRSHAGVVVLTDVTDQERRERAEREFVTNAAHELRTPLSAIASAVEVLQQGAKEQPADRDRFLAVVERQTTRLTRLAHALLTLARAQTRSESVRLEPVPLSPMLRDIAENAGDPSVSVELCCENVEVLAHSELLHQALDNLATNALKHASGQGVTLRATHLDHRDVRIEVADEGPGMKPFEAGRAFDRFYRAAGSNGEGFGLGLSIVREVVGVMDGTLSIESRSEEGTTVSIVLKSAGEARGCR